MLCLCLHCTLSRYHPYAELSESLGLKKCLSGIFSYGGGGGGGVLGWAHCLNHLSCYIWTSDFGISRLLISLSIIVKIFELYLIIVIKSEIWIVGNCLSVRSWNKGMRCMSRYVLIVVPISPNSVVNYGISNTIVLEIPYLPLSHRFNTVNLFQNVCNRHRVARPWRSFEYFTTAEHSLNYMLTICLNAFNADKAQFKTC